MKLVYKDMGHILCADEGTVSELIVENKSMFFHMIDQMSRQLEGAHGDWVLSIEDRPVEFGKYADLTVQFTPFRLNRKSLLTKLYTALEKNALAPENYLKTEELLSELERYMIWISEGFPFELNCPKLAIGPLIRAVAPEIAEDDKSVLERIFDYMELVRELDKNRLFVYVNMRSYFSDEEMQAFAESVVLHDFKVLLIESTESACLKHTKRFVVDSDLCEF